jgi:4-hydroxy-tetrahydrodipicolinate synthase
MDPNLRALEGISPPLATPMVDGEIDWNSFEQLLAHVGDGGVSGVFPCGTTGESASLTRTERRQLVERTIESVGADTPVIAGGSGTTVAETVDWIETLADIGVDAAVVTGPYFHNSNRKPGLERFFTSVADRSPLPLILYNIPSCVGESIPIETVASLATHEQISGLKDSSGDLAYGLRAKHQTPKDFLLFQGYDPLLLPSLRMGFDGGINALANVVPSVYTELYRTTATEDAAHQHHRMIEPLFEVCKRDGFAPATKALLVERDIIASSDVRPPLTATDVDSDLKIPP